MSDEIHRDLYDKINANTTAVAALTATVGVLTAQNERFIELLESDNARMSKVFKWVAACLFVLILFLSGALVYGAIGERGLHSVRSNMPTLTEIAPWHNDDDLGIYQSSAKSGGRDK